MSDTQAELDEILTELYKHFMTDPVGYEGKKNHHVNKAKQAILDWHNKQVLAIIGEDEPPEGLTSYYPGIERDSMHREGRNILREWQRNKLKENQDD